MGSLQRMFELGSPDTSLIDIPDSWIDPILEGMSAIFNATSIPERDSVFDIYCVHDVANFPVVEKGFIIWIDTNYTWTEAWLNLNSITGNESVDSLMLNYDLELFDLLEVSFYPFNAGLLRTDSLWNSTALITSFNEIEGVEIAEFNSIFGLAGKISYDQIGTDQFYNFSFEWNDCFDGCDNRKTWKFKVDENCTVTYLGFEEWGFFGVENLPDPINCNISTSLVEQPIAALNFECYPNPTLDFIEVKSNTDFKRNNFILYNAQGQPLKKGMMDNHSTLIDLSIYTAGIYFLQIGVDQKQFLKIIKR